MRVNVGAVRRGRVPWVALGAVLVAVAFSVQLGVRAEGEDLARCERFSQASTARLAADAGPVDGRSIVVVGDSWSVGLGLDRPAASWPSRLADELGARVRVAGFSGSGFGAFSSPCGRVSFADRTEAALTGPGARADLLVVEGGLNDVDQPDASIAAGFRRVLAQAGDRPVLVVGPASAPARAALVPDVDGLLERLSAQHGVAYLRTSHLDLPYLDDGLHLTEAGHRAFGDAVAAAVADLP